MLAIAAPSFNAPSETFIHDHVRTIAPGKTVLVCKDGRGAERFGNPVLSQIDPWIAPTSFFERAASAVRYRWRSYVQAGLARADHRRVVAFLKQHNVTALLAEYGPTGCLLMGACQEAQIPLFVHFHGYDASILVRQRTQVRHYRKLFRVAAGVIAPSRFLANKLADIGCPLDKLHVNPYGVDPNRFQPSSPKPGRILAVGRLVEKKAPHLTIQAFARIASRFQEARLDLIGDGPLRDHCEALVTKLGLNQRVSFHGVREPEYVAAQMRKACMFVQHSVTAGNGDCEGLPVAILEAMASALPVVSTRHSGIPEAVEHGTTGLLVAERDVTGMADCIATLLACPSRAVKMGSAGRERVLANFQISHSGKRLRSIIGLPLDTTPLMIVTATQ